MCDSGGVIYKGRKSGINQWKSAHALKTGKRTLAEALEGADVFLGPSVNGALTPEKVASMSMRRIIFAMANPDPEIDSETPRAIRPDAIVATGRSDYPNQVNNVLGFPYLFRGALDIRARSINDEMKIARADLARHDVPDSVSLAYGKQAKFGPEYIIPTPFDPRLIHAIPPAVAKAGMETGCARRRIEDLDEYAVDLKSRMDSTASILAALYARAKMAQARMVFAEGGDSRVLRAAIAYQRSGLGKALVVGRENDVREKLSDAGIEDSYDELEICNAANTPWLDSFKDFLYARLQRKGYDQTDVHRLAARDRHVFASFMLAKGHADALVTGSNRKSAHVLSLINHVFDAKAEDGAVGVTAVIHRGRLVFIADTLVHEWPDPEDLADIAERAVSVAKMLNQTPRVTFVSFSNFGYPVSERAIKMQEAPRVLEERGVDFEYDGEMAVDEALNDEVRSRFPFCKLSGPANILVVPARHSASISVKMLQKVAGSTVIGPILAGIDAQVQLCSFTATSNDVLNMAVMASVRAQDWKL